MAVEMAASALSRARRVDLAGAGASTVVTQQLLFSLTLLGLHVRFLPDSAEQGAASRPLVSKPGPNGAARVPEAWTTSASLAMFAGVRPEPSTDLVTRNRLAISTFSCSVYPGSWSTSIRSRRA